MSKRHRVPEIGWLTALIVGTAVMTTSPSVAVADVFPMAEVVDTAEHEAGAPIGVLWRGVVILAAGAVVSTGAYAVAMRRSRTRAGSRNLAGPETGIVQEALEDIEALTELGSDKAAHVLKEWMKESTHT
jgi:hypothetical protein